MRSLTRSNGGWLRKTTATTRMIPCLLAQVLIVSFCIPQTLEAGKEIPPRDDLGATSRLPREREEGHRRTNRGGEPSGAKGLRFCLTVFIWITS